MGKEMHCSVCKGVVPSISIARRDSISESQARAFFNEHGKNWKIVIQCSGCNGYSEILLSALDGPSIPLNSYDS